MSPYAYLAAARIDDVLPGPVEWQPVLLGGLFKMAGRSSWAVGDEERRREGMDDVERRAERYGLPPVRWPEPWPDTSLTAMRAAVYARSAGREREYAMAAFRTSFAEGKDLSDVRNVLSAAGAAGLEPGEVEAALADPEVKERLRAATESAHASGVFGVPTIAIGDEIWWGDDRLEEAALALSG
jgi:2-hydroxychromene-2-carboxylate isomerase